MPDVAMHHYFGLEVRAALPEDLRQALVEEPFLFALYGPDFWFMFQPGKTRQGRGRRMHTTRTGAFLLALARQAREGSARPEMFSYLAGFLCHYALDSTTHPYIIWQSTETWPTRRAHRDLEHALDVKLLQREGYWGEKHPVTDHHFPVLRLPERMASDLDAAYGAVYGWQNTLSDLNRCCARYRALYRVMEKPHSLLTGLATIAPTHRFRSIPHSKSAFLDRDVENLSHTPWHQAYARDLTSTESFPELYARALAEALRMIRDAWTFTRDSACPESFLAASLGNRSYLSGLDVEDPRNRLVRSLMPPD